MPYPGPRHTRSTTFPRLAAALLGVAAVWAAASTAGARPAASRASVAHCQAQPAFAPIAARNAQSLRAATWSVFGHEETGWEVYAPLVANEIATTCNPSTPGFALHLSRWQAAHALPDDGAMDVATLDALRKIWIKRRPFDAMRAGGACPRLPKPNELAASLPSESYTQKPVQARREALDAYRKLVSAAKRELPEASADPRLLTILTGYRDPGADVSSCSSHRTGYALDLFLGAAPGYQPDSAADANRLYQSRTAVYRWLVANAYRFGFVYFALEPRHWEWTATPVQHAG